MGRNSIKRDYPLAASFTAKGARMAEPKPPEKEDQWWEFCPMCGAKLINRKCRFVCSDPKCHYFMSCSEFDL
jgi:hypothetical protein